MRDQVEVAALFQEFAEQVVASSRVLDRTEADGRGRLAQALVAAGIGAHVALADALLAAAAPRVLMQRRVELTVEAEIARRDEAGFGLRVMPLNLGFRIAYGRSDARALTLTAVIAATPIVGDAFA